MKDSELKEAKRLLSLGRALACKKGVYASDTFIGFIPHFTENVLPTMAVTRGLNLIINVPWFIEEDEYRNKDTGIEAVAGSLFHEAIHVQQDLKRIEKLQNPELAGIAADLAANPPILRAGWCLPSWVLVPKMYGLQDFQTLEFYYAQLDKMPKAKLPKKSVMKIGSGSCGGISSPTQSPIENRFDGAIGRSQTDVTDIKQKVADKTQKMKNDRGFGNIPGDFKVSQTFERKESVVPWPKILARVGRGFIGSIISGDDNLSYVRPNKRAMVLGMVRPGPVSHQLIPAFIRDTSASMGNNQLNDTNNQIIDVMRELGLSRAYVIDADVNIRSIRHVGLKEIPKIQIVGRGGTSFERVFEDMKKHRICPDLAFYMTDGDAVAPKKPPPFPVIWCVVMSPYMRRPATWGTLVVCSNDPKAMERLEDPYEQ